MIGIVVANGPSRKDADLSKLPGMGTVIACNQTHELVECDYAVALDKVNYVKYSEVKDRKFNLYIPVLNKIKLGKRRKNESPLDFKDRRKESNNRRRLREKERIYGI